MTSESKTNIKIVFGAMTFGSPTVDVTRVHTLEDCSKILDVFQQHGHKEIDTARGYGAGTTEEYLGQLQWQKRGILMETKLYPTAGRNPSAEQWSHRAEDVRAGLLKSLKALNADKIEMFYLHAPDRNTPFEDTLREVDKLHKEGYFNRFGISNFQAWEVAKVLEICDKNGWIKPTAYQGMYNALHRKVEAELFPCLRHYKIAYYAYSPLAGGYLADRYHKEDKDEDIEKRSRFDPNKWHGKLFRDRYWNDPYFEGLEIIREAAKKYDLTVPECALRWLQHHSFLNRELGDAIIIGASNEKQLEQNLVDFEKGPLPEEVVKALEEAWEQVKGVACNYWH